VHAGATPDTPNAFFRHVRRGWLEARGEPASFAIRSTVLIAALNGIA
jgi:hypothetical protein